MVLFNSCPLESTLSGGEIQCTFESNEILDNDLSLLGFLLSHNSHLVTFEETGKGYGNLSPPLFRLISNCSSLKCLA